MQGEGLPNVERGKKEVVRKNRLPIAVLRPHAERAVPDGSLLRPGGIIL